jgi:two-component system chemotaxis response regulator CheB
MINGTDNSKLIRVLVTDDSAFMRTAITRMIQSDPMLQVVGSAQTGQECLQKVVSLKPDVITLDIEMPGMNGLETLKRLMKDSPLPVIMVSSLTQEGAEVTLEALHLGAFDYVPKQSSFVSLDIVKIRDDLVAKIKAAAESGRRRAAMKKAPAPTAPVPAHPAASRGGPQIVPSIIALGTSTGGPKALQEILPMFPADLPVPILIVQHMPPGFTGPFARRLNALSKIAVREAIQEEEIQPGVVYIAPAGQHMTVYKRGASKTAIRLGRTPEGMLHIPSVDVMMLSVGELFKSLTMGVIMTGMGADGVKGMELIKREGGFNLGQDEASCTVYGMPRSAAEAGVLHKVVPLNQIPDQIMAAVHYKRHAQTTA